jgi:succinate-semialdehyde dehydrogenase/glutarate-semialdehyde dehydrogenase
VVGCHANCKGAHRAIQQRNPATGEVLKTFTEHTDQEMLEALATADKAFVSWAALPIDGRAKIISHAARLLLERKSELAKLATLEMASVLRRVAVRSN